MSENVIQIEGLSKRYRLGVIGGKRLVDDVNRKWAKLRGKADPFSKVGPGATSNANGHEGLGADEMWALRDISFGVKQGEVLGIIGRNGAGKSTLLKILSRVTAPTFGEVRVKGRIASLLEVGTGFHPELTGRENVFLNGAILGMTKSEIRKRFDAIVAFSDIEKFIDTPVKRYSSGMKVRLAFSVAAHLEAEIMIVDEVLAVGDAEFQKKCLGKMKDISSGEGRTVLFVSHNMESMIALTSSAMLLEHGLLCGMDATRTIVAQYLMNAAPGQLFYEAKEQNVSSTRIEAIRLRTSLENNIQCNGESLEVEVEVSVTNPLEVARFEIYVCDELQQRVFFLWQFDHEDAPLFRSPGRYTLLCKIPKVHLYIGKYTLSVELRSNKSATLVEKLEGICPFEVIMNTARAGGWQVGEGKYIEDAVWSVKATR